MGQLAAEPSLLADMHEFVCQQPLAAWAVYRTMRRRQHDGIA
jgi:hypothetical protein